MTAEEHLKAGNLNEALASAQDAVRKSPAEARPRILLFQLFCVLGEWERAFTQLNVLKDLDSECLLLAQIFTSVIGCETFRAEVFAGKRSPLIFGEPEEWIGLLVRASQLVAQSEFAAAQKLREQAFEAAPAASGKINDAAFEWIADADSRLGPLLEVMLEGKYYWVPFSRIRSLIVEPPVDLRDLVWTPAHFVWINGGEASGFIPTRYPGSEKAGEFAYNLARKTTWQEQPGDTYLGLGQRVFATDQGEYPLLEAKRIEFSAPPASSTPER